MPSSVVTITHTPARITGLTAGTSYVGTNEGNLSAPTPELQWNNSPLMRLGSVASGTTPTHDTKLNLYFPGETAAIEERTNEEVWAWCLVEGVTTRLTIDEAIT